MLKICQNQRVLCIISNKCVVVCILFIRCRFSRIGCAMPGKSLSNTWLEILSMRICKSSIGLESTDFCLGLVPASFWPKWWEEQPRLDLDRDHLRGTAKAL